MNTINQTVATDHRTRGRGRTSLALWRLLPLAHALHCTAGRLVVLALRALSHQART